MILMKIEMEKVDFLVGNGIENVEELLRLNSLGIFSDETICFLSDISDYLLKDTEVRKYPDVATFAFFCRKANLKNLKRLQDENRNYRIGKGIIFHIAPGNVPVNFAYSLFTGLVTGNINIVKVPSKKFDQINIIINAINNVLLKESYRNLFSKRLFIVRYNKDSLATQFFSSFCDVRIIWGGDQTINEIRKFPISAKTTEITFSDRYSIAIIKAYSYLNCSNKINLVQNFYNDTYLFDQNACTSPHTIFWVGDNEEIKEAQKDFWDKLEMKLVEKKYEIQPVQLIDKLTTFFAQAITIGKIEKSYHASNEIWRVQNHSTHPDIHLFKCNSGYFNEINILSIKEITSMVNRKYQTIAYFGFEIEELNDWIIQDKPLGIDRIVPIGRTMDFSLIWDGYDLVKTLSRNIEIN